MLRALLYGLALLHLGPGLAFALLAFGCEGGSPFLGAICERSVLSSFALLSAGSWLLLILGGAAFQLVRLAGRGSAERSRLRIWALLSVLAFGLLLGVSGEWLTGSQHWFLAVPVSLAVGWLFLANPLACQTGADACGGSPQPSDKQRESRSAGEA